MYQHQTITEYISQRNKIPIEESVVFLDATINDLIDRLSKGQSVEMQGLGKFEVKSMLERTTVFFRFIPKLSNEGNAAVYEVITEMLLNGDDVSLPNIGIFHSIMDPVSDKIRISFILSPSLRSILNNQFSANSETKSELTQELREDNHTSDNPKEEEQSEKEPPVSSIPLKKTSKEKDLKELADDSSFRLKSILTKKILLLFSLIAIVLIFLLILGQCQEDESVPNEITKPSSKKGSELIELAKEHYGNASFWVYIYDSNKEKLATPFSTIESRELVFPDLKEVYNVDINDSLEIRRANTMAEEILKDYKYRKNQNINY